jgi:uncharacterized protein YegP (UPF0339 family)
MFLKIGSVFAVALVLGTVGCSAAGESIDDGSVEVSSKSAHFETFVGQDGHTYFDLVAGNGQNVLRSQGYTTSSGAKSGVASVVQNGVDPERYAVLEAKDGTYYFNLTALNHRVIGTSQMYATKSNAERGAKTVQALTLLLGATPQVVPAAHQARFEVFRGEDKKYYFHLRAGNGEIVLDSQGYTEKSSAVSGIASVKTNGVQDTRWKVGEAINGEYDIRLVAGNGRTIGSGELYVSQSNADKGVATIEGLLSQDVPVVQ